MSESKSTTIYNDYLLGETPETIEPEINNEIHYNCSECSSLIEIISINEENNTIEFNCLNKNNNHNKKLTMPIKEYLEKMKKYSSNNNLNKDICETHNINYIYYCFDCNCHICKECLKTRNHLNHSKNNIIEIEPMKEELNIIEEVIQDYNKKIDNLSIEKIRKVNELKNTFNNNKKIEEDKNKVFMEKNEKKITNELEINKEKYLDDIIKIIYFLSENLI